MLVAESRSDSKNRGDKSKYTNDNLHGVDSFGQLRIWPLSNTTGIYPEILQAVPSGLGPAKLNLSKACLALSGAVDEIFECNVFVIRSPSMRENGIFRKIVVSEILGDGKLAVAALL